MCATYPTVRRSGVYAAAVTVPTRDDFLLDPDLVFLHHGSFGAVLRVVQEAYEQLQRSMERNPVAWLQRSAEPLMAEARARVAQFVGAAADVLLPPQRNFAHARLQPAAHLLNPPFLGNNLRVVAQNGNLDEATVLQLRQMTNRHIGSIVAFCPGATR